jgi:SulP family sulfate permease
MIKRAPTADIIILVTTFVLTVFADLVIAVNIGVILATLQFLRRMSTSVEVRLQSQQELTRDLDENYFRDLSEKVAVYAIYGPLFFGATENLVKAIQQQRSLPQHLIIRFTWVPFTDITGIQMLEGLIEEMRDQGITVCITETNLRVKQKLAKAGIFEMIGPQHNSDTLAQGLKQLAC